MNRWAIIGLVVILSVLSFLAGFFVDRHRRSNDEQGDAPEVTRLKAELKTAQADAVDFATERRPKLWVDQEAAKAIQQLGYDRVWFFRWRNGVLDGWVEFDEADGPQRFPLDASRRAFDQWAKEGMKPVATGSRGDLLVTLRQVGKSDEFDCEVIADYMVHRQGGGGVGETYSKKGKVKLEKNQALENSSSRFGSYSIPGFSPPFEVSVDRYANKKAVPWVNIKLVEQPK